MRWCSQRIYQALGYNWSNTLICAIVCAAAPLFQWTLIYKLGLGYLGAAIAASVYNVSYLFLQVPHLVFAGRSNLFLPTPHTLRWGGLRDYLGLMAPGFMIVCAEWWVLELMVVWSGWLHPQDIALGAFTVTSTVQALALMAWIGLGVAASVEVGKHIGASDLSAARRAARNVLLLGVLLATAWALSLSTLSQQIAQLFTASTRINALAAQLMPAIGIVAILDATSNTLSGVCSGLGLQVQTRPPLYPVPSTLCSAIHGVSFYVSSHSS